MTRTRVLTMVALIAGAVALTVMVMRRQSAPRTGDLEQFPASVTGTPVAPASADFAGADACASCHSAEYAVWRASTHGRAGGTSSEADVVARFDGQRIAFSDAEVIPERAGTTLTFTVIQRGRAPIRFRVDGVIGGAHMLGGGTQGFVSRFPDGTLRFLPFDFAKREGVWFCNTTLRGGSGWVPITPDLSIAACGDWPPSRILGDDARIANCSGCHGSRVEVRFDTTVKRYRTSAASLRIDCESCHGPGARHVQLVKEGRSGANIGMSTLASLNKSQSVTTCLGCHAVKDVLNPGYRPGANLARFYSIALAQLGDSPLHADGRVRTFAYQEGHLSSDCYVNGGMTCIDCHNPHSQKYRDVRGTALASPLDDRQCTSCHVSKAAAGPAHTKHPAKSAGSACVSCHMPYLQHPEIGNRIRFARSDHTIPIPRPAADSAQGIVPACVSCHANRPVATLEQDVTRLWGALKPRAQVVDAVMRLDRLTNAEDAARALLVTGPAPLSGRMAGIGAFIEKFLQPDMPRLPRGIETQLLSLADDPDMDVRALALASLHYARGNDPHVRTELVSRLARSGAGDAPLRRRWTLVLGFLGDRAQEAGDGATAALLYRKALELEPTHPQLLLNLGLALSRSGDMRGAVEQYQRSLAADPIQPAVFLNLGIALESQEAGAAVEAFRNALRINPFESLAWFNLGNALLRQQNPAAAAQFYEQAVSLDPSLAQGHFYLARAYALTGRVDKAIVAVDDGLQFKPGDPEALALRAELVRMR